MIFAPETSMVSCPFPNALRHLLWRFHHQSRRIREAEGHLSQHGTRKLLQQMSRTATRTDRGSLWQVEHGEFKGCRAAAICRVSSGLWVSLVAGCITWESHHVTSDPKRWLRTGLLLEVPKIIMFGSFGTNFVSPMCFEDFVCTSI